jgi:hypothetical protein
MNMKKLNLVCIFTAVLALLTITFNQAAFAQKAGKKRNDLTGTWLLNLQFDEPANLKAEDAAKAQRLTKSFSHATTRAAELELVPQVNTLAPFTTIETFHSDGTFAENSLVDYFPPSTTPGRGAWERIGDGEFSLTLYGVLIGSTVDAEFQGMYRERVRIKTDATGDLFSGNATVEIYDPVGNFVFSFDGTFQGRRASLAPAP